MRKPKPNQSIIHGTMRTQDILPELLDAVRDYAPHHYAAYRVTPFRPIPAWAWEYGDSEWWNSEAAMDLMNELSDILNEVAPEGCYFGSHPGNSSDLGFWPDEEEED